MSLGQGGLIDVEAGTLRGSSSSQGFYTNNLGGLFIASGATFNGVEGAVRVDALTGSGTLSGGYGTQGSTTIGVAGGGGTFSGSIGDSNEQGGKLALTKAGAGTQILTGADTYTGGTIFNGGVLNVGSAGALGSTGTLSFTGGTLQYSAANTTDYSGRFSAAANQAYSVDTNGQNVTLASALASSGGSLAKLGAGTLTLMGNNTYTGGTTFAGGAVNVGSTGALGSTGTLSFTGGTLQYSAANTTDYSGRFSTAANQAFRIDTNGQNIVFASGLTSSSGSLAKLGAGNLTLTGVSDLTAATANYSMRPEVFAGTLTIGNGGSLALVNNLYLDSGVTLALSGTGSLNLNSGGLIMQGDTPATQPNLTISDNASLRAAALYAGYGAVTQNGGSVTITGRLYLGQDGGGTYLLNSGTVTAGTTYIGSEADSTFTQNGGTHTTGLLVLGEGSVRGTYALNGGTLVAGQVSNLVNRSGTSPSPGTFFFNGGTLQASADSTTFVQNLGNGTRTLDAYVQAGGAFIDTAGHADTITVPMQHDATANAPALDGGLTKLGAGTLTLTGNNTYTGPTTISAGTLQVGNGGTAGTLGTNTGAITDNGTLAFNRSDSVTLPNAVSGTGGLIQAGTGTLTLTGNSAYQGTTRVNGGTVVLVAGASLSSGTTYIGDATSGAFIQNGGSFSVGTNNFVLGRSLGATGTYTLNAGSLSTGEADIGYYGAGTFNQSGGTFTTNGSTLYLGTFNTGTYNLSGGTLTTGSVEAANGTGTFNFNGGMLRAAAGSTSFFQDLTTANVQAGGAKIDTNSFNATVAQNLVHDPALGSTADGGLTKLGAGTLTLTGTNTFTGPVNINAGTLAAASEASLGAAGNTVTVNAGAQLQFVGDTTLARTYNLGLGTLGVGSGNTVTIGNGAVINGGYLAGPGTFALGGGSTVNAATAQIGSTLSQTDGGAATLNNVTVRGALNQTGGTLAVNYVTGATSSRITVGGTVNATGTELDGTTTINSGGTVSTSSTSLYLGAGSRTTINAGGTLAAEGGTSIELNAGLLVNNGRQNGALSVNYGSTARAGTPSATFGDVTVNEGGKFGSNASGSNGQNAVVGGQFATIRLTGGNGLAATNPALMVGPQFQGMPGTTNLHNFTLNADGQFSIRVQDATGAAGAGYDLTHASGTLTLNGSAAAGGQIFISLSSLNASGNPGMAADFDPTHNYQFVLIQADGGITGYVPGEFAVDTSGFTNITVGGSFAVIEPDPTHLVLAFTAVPEPSTWALVGIGGTSLLSLMVRRRTARM